jgi:predicted DNA-binding transcriptional regulator YafY
MSDVRATGHRFRLESAPDPVELVAQGLAVAPYAVQARVRIDATPEEISRFLPRTVAVTKRSPADAPSSIVTIGADTVEWLVLVLAGLPFHFEVIDPAELRTALRDTGRRLARGHR